MADFNIAVTVLLAVEGSSYQDSDGVEGGSKFGITKRSLDAYQNKFHPPAVPLKVIDLTQSMAETYYRVEWWPRQPYDQISDQTIANLLFCSDVNMATGSAVKCLQVSLAFQQVNGVNEVDGVFGPYTVKRLQDEPEISEVMIRDFANVLRGYYLGRHHPDEKGLLDRIDRILELSA